MKKFRKFVREFEEFLRDMKFVLVGLLVVIAAAIVVDRAIFVWNNEEYLLDARYGAVAWPGESRFIKNSVNLNYDGHGTIKVGWRNGLLMTAENFFFYPSGRIEVCRYRFGKSCKPVTQIPQYVLDIARGQGCRDVVVCSYVNPRPLLKFLRG